MKANAKGYELDDRVAAYSNSHSLLKNPDGSPTKLATDIDEELKRGSGHIPTYLPEGALVPGATTPIRREAPPPMEQFYRR
jgi:hypothetical protein